MICQHLTQGATTISEHFVVSLAQSMPIISQSVSISVYHTFYSEPIGIVQHSMVSSNWQCKNAEHSRKMWRIKSLWWDCASCSLNSHHYEECYRASVASTTEGMWSQTKQYDYLCKTKIDLFKQ